MSTQQHAYRAFRIQRKRNDVRITRLYHQRCSGIQINVMDIGQVYDAGHAAIAADHAITDEVLGEIILDFVNTIRKN